MAQIQNKTRQFTRNALLAFAVAAGILFVWMVGTSPRRPVPFVEKIAPLTAPRILSAADATAMLLANYYPPHAGAGGAALGNESLLKIVPNPAGAGFVPLPQALAQIERETLERLAKPGWHPIHPEKYIRPIFPERYAEPIEVASQACKVRSKPLGANASSTATLAGDGSLIYADAFSGCDVVYRSSALKTEEFIVLRDSHAQAEWSWELYCGAALTPRLTPMNSLELVDGKGVPRLRINAPEGKDAAGVRLRVGERLKLTLDGARITVVADVDGLKFPVIIDPSWSSTGSMTTGRAYFTCTVLASGRVLAAGGSKDTNFLSSAEIFDPATGVWSSTNNMSVVRTNHNAVLLTNGKVLAVGGSTEISGSTPDLASAELYDEANGIWTGTGSLTVARQIPSISVLQDGKALTAGGFQLSQDHPSSDVEVYDPSSQMWTSTTSMTTTHSFHTATVLSSGKVLVAGGKTALDVQNVAEVYDPVSTNWTSSTLSSARYQHEACLLNNGTVLVMGGLTTGLAFTATAEIYDPNTGAWTSTSSMLKARCSHTATLLNNGDVLVTGGAPDDAFSAELFHASSGTWTATHDMLTRRVNHRAVLLGNGTVLITGGFGTNSEIASSEIYDPNGTNAPTVLASASPTTLGEGQAVSFFANGNDLDGDTLSYSWDFGDGSSITGQNPTHPYSTSGTYTAIVTVTDPLGKTGTASVVIHVVSHEQLPTARFSTSDVVAFVGVPFTFDATFSTDPGNNIVQYKWSFGDGTPDGAGQVISKIYNQAGPVTASLTVVNGTGLTDTVSRVIEVLPANEIGLFNSQIDYTVKWDRGHANADSLTLSAVLNVGTAQVGAGSAVALEVVGQRFTGTLDGKFRDFSNPNSKWQVKANIRGKPFGEVTVKITLKHANLGLGFNQAGVLATADLHDVITKDIPVHIEIAGRTFNVPIGTDFKFRKGGTAATGNGTGPN